MELWTAFSVYKDHTAAGWNFLQRIYLSLRRNEIDSLEQLRQVLREDPQRIGTIRGIGPKSQKLLLEILVFYEHAGGRLP